jgi:uncharacterized protein YgiM (DUF1202 family)
MSSYKRVDLSYTYSSGVWQEPRQLKKRRWKRQMKKKVLALVLAAAMVLAVVPVGVMAGEWMVSATERMNRFISVSNVVNTTTDDEISRFWSLLEHTPNWNNPQDWYWIFGGDAFWGGQSFGLTHITNTPTVITFSHIPGDYFGSEWISEWLLFGVDEDGNSPDGWINNTRIQEVNLGGVYRNVIVGDVTITVPGTYWLFFIVNTLEDTYDGRWFAGGSMHSFAVIVGGEGAAAPAQEQPPAQQQQEQTPQQQEQAQAPAVTTPAFDTGADFVANRSVNVRTSRNTATADNILGYIPRGTAVTVLWQVGNWYAVQFGDVQAYVWAAFVSEAVDVSGAEVMTVTTNALYVRSGPGVSHGAIGNVRSGDAVYVLGYSANGNWARIAWFGGTAYVFARYLR